MKIVVGVPGVVAVVFVVLHVGTPFLSRPLTLHFIDETYARKHEEIILYQREGETLHLRSVAVDIVNARRERFNIDQSLSPIEHIIGSDLILDEADGAGQLFAFTTCSYQTWNSPTTVFATGRSQLSRPLSRLSVEERLQVEPLPSS